MATYPPKDQHLQQETHKMNQRVLVQYLIKMKNQVFLIKAGILCRVEESDSTENENSGLSSPIKMIIPLSCSFAAE
ncbi:conserved hypothetical protein [Ricinus communis]|uniref:Uncharacterized protein n=1 Tax=Ricinus communis TaxID=3988 RepID=B9SL77_RICCO|nr:conserved hypothetical protein [Ricinus communis]